MRIELAKLLLRRPSIFLLDEPTNHLDIESIQWLEDYLKNYNGAVLLISHDRAFLDNVTTRTVETLAGQSLRLQSPLLPIRRAACRTAGAADGRLREPAADDRKDRRVHREIPLQAYQIEPGAVAHQATRPSGAYRGRGGGPRHAQHQVSARPAFGTDRRRDQGGRDVVRLQTCLQRRELHHRTGRQDRPGRPQRRRQDHAGPDDRGTTHAYRRLDPAWEPTSTSAITPRIRKT